MTEVFMPLNLEMERVVVEKSDLLEESEMPPSLLQLCAHVEAYKTVIKRWENHDFSEHTSVIDFPAREVAEYVGTRFSVLKDEQMRLLGLLKKGARWRLLPLWARRNSANLIAMADPDEVVRLRLLRAIRDLGA
jgi:hypothetical protein